MFRRNLCSGSKESFVYNHLYHFHYHLARLKYAHETLQGAASSEEHFAVDGSLHNFR